MNGYLPADYNQVNFATFDIESIGIPFNDHSTGNTQIHSLQRVVCVSITKSFGPAHSATEVFMRQQMTEAAYKNFITKMMVHLHSIQKEMVDLIPNQILQSISHLQTEVAAFKAKERNYSLSQVILYFKYD